MQSILTPANKAHRGFPKLMQDPRTGMVVLFTEPGRGMVVHRGNGYSIGVYLDGQWKMGGFFDYTGTVTLSN